MSDTLTEARTLLDQQKFEEALELLKTVQPKDLTVRVSVARALSGLGHWEQAHSMFSEAVEEDPDCHEAWAGRGLIYFLTGHFQQAAPDLAQAIEAAPMNGRYRGLQGVLLAQTGDAAAALKDLEKAYDLGCQDEGFLFARAQIHLATRQAEKAQEVLELAEKAGADEAQLAALEGALYMLKNEHKEALASYRFAAEKAPESEAHWMNLLTLTASLDRGRLLEEAQQALGHHPNSGDIIQVVVGAYREAGKVKEAFQVLHDAIERDPENPLFYFQLGLGYANAGKFDQAVVQFSKALKIVPRFPRALDARGKCLEQLGREDEAKADFERSYEIRKEDAERQGHNVQPRSEESE